ncbi:MAG TPA: FoF1 ATP synthase subunit gamma, partial [Candidatus Staskawiczbacteria bacterium]|nr:FoF1 ATP synthase subunit gamma [Candidatus Staskawiczbacteria bacterium]
MESPQNIKKRLKSVKNIGQITKAMELVSATKMRKSQQVALDSRPYSFAALDLLATISALDVKLPELLQIRPVKKVLFVLVASDKGLAGAFNSSVFKKFEQHLKIHKTEWEQEEHSYIAVGEKAYNYLSKRGFNVLKKVNDMGDFTDLEEVQPMADFLAKGYLDGTWDRVIVISTHFITALKQEPHVRRVLPIDFDHIAKTVKETIPERGKFAELMKENDVSFVPDREKIKEYIIEPTPQKVLEKLAEHLFLMTIYQLVLEANA